MSAPLVISFWMRAAFTFVDTIYAATIGDDAVAAIGLTVPLEFGMIAIWIGLSSGLTSVLSRAMGANQGRKIDQYLKKAWSMVWIVSPVFLAVGIGVWFYAPRMGLAAGLEGSFRIYGTTIIAGSALTTFWSVIPDSVVKAHQDTRSTMWAGIVSNVLNLALNTLFLFVFHWGVFGIALSTVLGRIGGLAYALHRARCHETRRRSDGPGPDLSEDPAPYRSILALAVPGSLGFLLMALETAAINWLLSLQEHATEVLTAYSIYYRIALFAINPVIAAGVALLPYSARRFGRNDIAGIRKGLRETYLATLAYVVFLVTPVMAFGSPWFASRLAESEISIRYTEMVLWVVPLACLAGAPFLICRPVFEGMQRGKPGLVMAVIRYLVLTFPLAWGGILVAGRMGHPPLYGMVAGLLLTAVIASLGFALWLRAALAGIQPD
jgi:Na+-driven multidrug efflux pump